MLPNRKKSQRAEGRQVVLLGEGERFLLPERNGPKMVKDDWGDSWKERKPVSISTFPVSLVVVY